MTDCEKRVILKDAQQFVVANFFWVHTFFPEGGSLLVDRSLGRKKNKKKIFQAIKKSGFHFFFQGNALVSFPVKARVIANESESSQ